MKRPYKVKYIITRIFCIASVLALVLFVFFMNQFILWVLGKGTGLRVIVAFLSLLLYTVVWLGWVIHPYRKWEKLQERFTTGHIIPEGQLLDEVMLAPSSARQVEMIEDLLKSPQMMDLNKRQAQYLALQNQINPHFLYNTLESIRGEALIAGLGSVAEMTEALAKFFRYTITKVENLVSVEEELENCETYFRIQQYRFGDRLRLHIEYDEAEREDIMNCRIPKLTLQPILENSIIHGTELKIGTGNLKIKFELTEKRLLIRISDDGVGMDEDTLAKLNAKLSRKSHINEEGKGGIALANVNNRIHLIFGEEYGMHIYSVYQMGTDVEITIPVTYSLKGTENGSMIP